MPGGDDPRRYVCAECGTVHYQNPKIVTGCLAVWQDSVLLCKRAIEPRGGYWTVPAGFMELDETVIQGAIRETWEEARAKVEILAPYCLFNLLHVNQLYIIYRARLIDLNFSPVAVFRCEAEPSFRRKQAFGSKPNQTTSLLA